MRVDWLEQDAADVPAADDWFAPAELGQLCRLRIAKRRADWRLGRWTAKLAAVSLAGLDGSAATLRTVEVGCLPSGAPRIFRLGVPMAFTISLTHRAGRAACAISSSGAALGCDLEVAEPRSDAFVADYFSDHERTWLARCLEERPWLATLFWSAKESALKALGVGLARDTRDLQVHLDELCPDDTRTSGWHPLSVACCDGRVFHGWWQHEDSRLRTVVASPIPAVPFTLTPRSDSRNGPA